MSKKGALSVVFIAVLVLVIIVLSYYCLSHRVKDWPWGPPPQKRVEILIIKEKDGYGDQVLMTFVGYRKEWRKELARQIPELRKKFYIKGVYPLPVKNCDEELTIFFDVEERFEYKRKFGQEIDE